MTTIAYDGNMIAADSHVYHDGVLVKSDCVKVELSNYKYYPLVAGAGSIEKFELYRMWVDEGCQPGHFPNLIEREDYDTSLVAIDDLGAAVEFDRTHIPTLVTTRPLAWGSGRLLAMGAMHYGADAIEAVQIAMKLDPFTGGEIIAYDVTSFGLVDHKLNGRELKRGMAKLDG